MLILKCDRCGKEINAEDYCLKVEVQEFLYKGEASFYIDTECLSSSRILCNECNNRLKDFMRCSINYY